MSYYIHPICTYSNSIQLIKVYEVNRQALFSFDMMKTARHALLHEAIDRGINVRVY